MSNEQPAEEHGSKRAEHNEAEQQGTEQADSSTVTAEPRDSADSGQPVTEGEPADETAEETIARLEQELDATRAQADDYWNRLVRAEAEKDNIRKRAQKDVDTARKQSLEKLAGELLAVRDSLEMGVAAAHQDDADVEKIREGTDLTLRMLTQAMEKFSIEEINPVGEKFNPDLHQAMSMQEMEGYEPNTVVSVMQKGYRLEDRLLRPALVMVAK